MVPFFALLEICLDRIAALFGGNANAARLTLAGALVVGFYGTWLAVRS